MRNKIEDIFNELDLLATSGVADHILWAGLTERGLTPGSSKVYVSKWRKARGTGRSYVRKEKQVDGNA